MKGRIRMILLDALGLVALIVSMFGLGLLAAYVGLVLGSNYPLY